jgi:hypothetical protein
VPKVVSEDELRALFDEFGTMTEVEVKIDNVTANCRGFGFVTFAKRKVPKYSTFSYLVIQRRDGSVNVTSSILNKTK